MPVRHARPTSRPRGRPRAAFGQPAARLRLGVLHPVVPVQLSLLPLRELAVGVDARGVLDLRLLERNGHLSLRRSGVPQWDEGGLAAEQAGLDQRPLRLVRVGVEVDLLDLPDLVAVAVAQLVTAPAEDFLARLHGGSLR